MMIVGTGIQGRRGKVGQEERKTNCHLLTLNRKIRHSLGNISQRSKSELIMCVYIYIYVWPHNYKAWSIDKLLQYVNTFSISQLLDMVTINRYQVELLLEYNNSIIAVI
jgi:hypothetical protein